MLNEKNITGHYKKPGLLKAIERSLIEMGKSFERFDIDDLSAIDELHIGGRKASKQLLSQINISPDDEILDIGCGIGGTARFAATHYSANITGIDLSNDFISIANELTARIGLRDKIKLYHGNAIAMPFHDNSFDGGYLMHVGMNVNDKQRLFSEAQRVLRSGALLGVYDVMKVGMGTLSYPVPWSESSNICAISSIEIYRYFLEKAGFEIISERNKRQFALDFFTEQKQKREQQDHQTVSDLNLVMGENMSKKMANIAYSIQHETISPIEIIALKR